MSSNTQSVAALVRELKAGNLSKTDFYASLSSIYKKKGGTDPEFKSNEDGGESAQQYASTEPLQASDFLPPMSTMDFSDEDAEVNGIPTPRSAPSPLPHPQSPPETKARESDLPGRQATQQASIAAHLSPQERRQLISRFVKQRKESMSELQEEQGAPPRQPPGNTTDAGGEAKVEEIKSTGNDTFALSEPGDASFTRLDTLLRNLGLDPDASSQSVCRDAPPARLAEAWVDQEDQADANRKQVSTTPSATRAKKPRRRKQHSQRRGPSTWDRLYADIKTRSAEERRRHIEQRKAEEMARRCTFQPQINPLPSTMYSARHNPSVPFYQRVTQWSRAKERQGRAKQIEKQKAELEECTFKPRVSARSSSMFDNLSTSTRHRIFQERSRARTQAIEREVQRKRLEEDETECTFQPALNKKSLDIVASKGNSDSIVSEIRQKAELRRARKSMYDASVDQECTFHPKINPIGSDMVTAKLYVNQDPFERLARPHQPLVVEDLDSDDGVKHLFASPDQARTDDGSPSFSKFLARQEYFQQLAQERVEQTRRRVEKDYGKPKINPKTYELLADKPDFYTRLNQSSTQKQMKMHEAARDPKEWTFKPRITAMAQRSKGRTVEQLSAGNKHTREAKLKHARMELQRDELHEATFQPNLLSSAVKRKTARYSLRVDPEHKAWSQQRDQKRKTLMEERKKKEAEEERRHCTFKPEIRPSPAFVRRIAKSAKQAKAQVGQDMAGSDKSKPDWK